MLQNVLRHQAVTHTKETFLSSLRSRFLIRHVPSLYSRLELALHVLNSLSKCSTCSSSLPNTHKVTFHFLYGKLHLQANSICFMENVHMSSSTYPLSFSNLSKPTHIAKPELPFSSIFMTHVCTISCSTSRIDTDHLNRMHFQDCHWSSSVTPSSVSCS